MYFSHRRLLFFPAAARPSQQTSPSAANGATQSLLSTSSSLRNLEGVKIRTEKASLSNGTRAWSRNPDSIVFPVPACAAIVCTPLLLVLMPWSTLRWSSESRTPRFFSISFTASSPSIPKRTLSCPGRGPGCGFKILNSGVMTPRTFFASLAFSSAACWKIWSPHQSSTMPKYSPASSAAGAIVIRQE